MSVPHEPGSGDLPRPRRWRLLVAALLLATASLAAGLVLLLLGWPRPSPVEPPEVSVQGADSEVAETVTAARQEVLDRPRSAAAWGHLGHVLRAHGYDEPSNVCFAEAERLDSSDPRWPYLQGAHLLLRDPAAGIPRLQRAVELCPPRSPQAVAARLRLAETLLQCGRGAEAEQQFLQVLREAPEHPRAHFGLGLVAAERQDHVASVGHWMRSLQHPSARKKSAIQLAATHLRAGNQQAAAQWSDQVGRLPPDSPWFDPFISEYLQLEVGRQSRFLQAERLEKQGRLQEALPLFRQLAQDAPNAHGYVAWGIALSKLGRFHQAEQVLREAVRMEPAKVQAHYFLSVVLFYQAEPLLQQPASRQQAEQKLQAAVQSAQQAVQLKPDHGLAYLYLGLASQRQGLLEQAIEAFRKARQCRPEFVEPHLHLGETLLESGQRAEALVHLQQAAQLAGQHDPRPRQALARARQDSPPEAPPND